MKKRLSQPTCRKWISKGSLSSPMRLTRSKPIAGNSHKCRALNTSFSSKAINPRRSPRPNNCFRAIFPPQAHTIDKGHGRIDDRKLWSKSVDGATIGLSGAAQIFCVRTKTDYLRAGKVIKTTEDVRYGVTSLSPEQADPETLLGLVRGYWGIEIKQHYRRDHTQREDHCHVRETLSARNLSLMRSMAIFLYERQRWRRGGERSLPDWQSKNHRNPNPLIGQLIASTE